jgi:alanine or glycine:cation symporter, AGCS family
MLDIIIAGAGKLASFLWGPWTMVFIAIVSTYLTVRSGFFQFSKFGLIMKNTFGKMFEKVDKSKTGGMTPFQAASTALAGTVGMGNVAGVATAIAMGGPGAVFWMWVFALLGMISKCAEVTLAVHYREIEKDGSIHGGPMYYMKKGLGWKPLANIFCVGVLINAFLAAGLLQPHTVGRSFLASYNVSPYLITAILAIGTGIVVIGGLKRIGTFCEKLVPGMAAIYIVAGLIIFIINIGQAPEIFGMIFKYAFAPAPAMGGFTGAVIASAIQKGMSRGMLSNEAGLGTAPMVHATAKVDHPFAQGLWGSFEVFVDTMIICTITAFLILSTGVMETGLTGVELTLAAFGSVYPPAIANLLLSVSILLFCWSTQIGFFVYYETAVINLFGKGAMKYFKWLYLVPGIIFAGVSDVNALWTFADVATGVCAIPNLIAVLALSGAFFKLKSDYMEGKNEYATAIVDENKNYVRSSKYVESEATLNQ